MTLGFSIFLIRHHQTSEHVPARATAMSSGGVVQCLFDRNSSSQGNKRFGRRKEGFALSRLRLYSRHKVHKVPNLHSRHSLSPRNPSRILEIVCTAEYVFALSSGGQCAAFMRRDLSPVSTLNDGEHEFIQTVYYNRRADALVIVSVLSTDKTHRLHCREIPVRCVGRRDACKGKALFRTEKLSWPSFIEFDPVNEKILTFSAPERVYKVWSLAGYGLLYKIDGVDVDELKVSEGLVLIVYKRKRSHVPLKLLAIETGRVLFTYKHLLHRQRHLDFVEQCAGKIIIKQDNHVMQIIDVRTKRVVNSAFSMPASFLFLHKPKLFLTFGTQKIEAWGIGGRRTMTVDHAFQQHPEMGANCVVTKEQNYIFVYHRRQASIHVSEIRTGRRVAALHLPTYLDPEGHHRGINAESHVTAMLYADDDGRLYTGSSDGTVCVWSP